MTQRGPVEQAQAVSVAGRQRAPRVAGHNIPVELATFVPRDVEMAKIRALLGQNRLVTILGPGGAGKTRLAQQVRSGPCCVTAGGASRRRAYRLAAELSGPLTSCGRTSVTLQLFSCATPCSMRWAAS